MNFVSKRKRNGQPTSVTKWQSDTDTQTNKAAETSELKNTASDSEGSSIGGLSFAELTAGEGPSTRSTSQHQPNGQIRKNGTQLLLPDIFQEANLEVFDCSQGHRSDSATLKEIFDTALPLPITIRPEVGCPFLFLFHTKFFKCYFWSSWCISLDIVVGCCVLDEEALFAPHFGQKL